MLEVQGCIFGALLGACVATPVLSCLDRRGFYDLYLAAAGCSFQKFRNRAVFSSSMVTQIRFQKNIRPRKAALCTHRSAANNARGFCSSPPSAFPGSVLLQHLAKIVDLSGFVPKFWWECGQCGGM